MSKPTRSERAAPAVGSQFERSVRPLPAMPPAWRLMGRANAFVPWILLEHCHKMEDACRKAAEWKARGKFYAVHVRAN
jgi:hypothetical protein